MPENDDRDALVAQLVQIERERDEVARSLPAHSTPPVLLIRLEDLDEQITALRTQIDALAQDASGLL